MRLVSRIISSILCISLPLQAMAEVRFVYRMSVDGSLPEGNYTSVGDYTPDAFNFADKTNVSPSTAIFSDPVTVTGIDTTAGISIQGGCYLINDEDVSACHAEPGTVASGDRIKVRLMSSPSWETTTQARVSIGGISDSFSVRTRAEPVSVRLGPDADGTPPDGQVTVDYTFDFATLADVDGGPIDQPARSQELTWNVIGGEVPEGLFFSEATGLLFGEPTTSEEATFSVAASHPDGASDDETYTVTISPAPNAPDAFSFTPQTGVEPGVELFSEEVTLSGLERSAMVTATGAASARMSVNGGALVTSATVNNGDRIRMRVISPNSFGATAAASLAIGEFSTSFTVTVRETDQTPDAFTFVSLTEQAPNSEATSTQITLAGFEGSVGISISGLGSPAYSLNGGAWTSVAGTAAPGDTVRIKLTSGAANSTRVATLTVGGVAGTFSVSSAAEDAIPDLLAFDPVSGASESTLVSSAAEMVSGINVPVTISVSGEGSPEYRINSGNWSSTAGSVRSGDLVSVRLTAGAAGTTRTATLFLAGIEVPFSVSTVAADTTPDAFAFSPVTVAPSAVATTGPVTLTGFDGSIPVTVSGHASALYSLDGVTFTADPGTVGAGAEIWLRVTASATEGSVRTVTLTAGSGTADFAVTSQDITPNVFTFSAATGVDPGSISVSNDQTITSITGAVAISISGQGSPEYRINGGDWTSNTGTVQANDVVAVRLTAGAANITRTATLTVGGRQAAYSVTARAPSTTPDSFTFTSALVTAGTVATAGPVTLTGFQDAIEVSVSGDPSALYSLDGVTFTATPAQITPGAQVWVRGTASNSEGSSRTITLTAGTGSGSFVITTQDRTPDSFTFAAVTDATPSTVTASGIQSINGISGTVPISITGDGTPEYSLNGGAWTSSAGTVMANDSVSVRLTSGAGGETRSASLTIGSSTFTFSVTARLFDTTPDSFSFTPVLAAPEMSAVSNKVTLTGFEGSIRLSISGDTSGLFSLDGTTFDGIAKYVTSGQDVWVRVTAPSFANQSNTATLTAGSVSAPFTVTAQDLSPTPFSFTTVTGAEPGALTTSSTVILSGITGNVPVSISGDGSPTYQVNGGEWSASPGTVVNGDSVAVRLTAGEVSATRTATLTIGTMVGTFAASTRSGDSTPDAFSFESQTVAAGSAVTVGPVTLAGFEGVVPVSVSGDATDQYSLDGTTFTSTAGNAGPGQQIWLRVNASPTEGQSRVVVLTAGGTSASFTVISEDFTPDLFSFSAASGVNPDTITTSSQQTISGISVSVPVSISGTGGPSYSINGGAWGDTAGTVMSGDTIAVRLTSGTFGENRAATLTVGTRDIPFSVTTRPYDTTPDQADFTTSMASAGAITTVGPVAITGFDGSVSVSVSGDATALYSLDGVNFGSTTGSISAGANVWLRAASSSSNGGSKTIVLTTGSVNSNWVLNTHDTVPDAFSFTAVGGANLSTAITSESKSISGITTSTAISISGGLYSVNGGAFRSTASTINNGDTVRVQLTSSASFSAQTSATVTIGGVAGSFFVTTRAQDSGLLVNSSTSTVIASCYTPYTKLAYRSVSISGLDSTAVNVIITNVTGTPSNVYPTINASVSNGGSLTMYMKPQSSTSTHTATVQIKNKTTGSTIRSLTWTVYGKASTYTNSCP